MSTNYDIENLPEGTYLYEESSVRKVSQAIRTISGVTRKFSHKQQPDAIRDIVGKVFSPTFTIGKAAGGIGFWGSSGGFRYTLQPGDGSNGPILTNFLYTLRNNEKNAKIIFSIKRIPNVEDYAFAVHIGNIDIRCRNDAAVITVGQYSTTYNDGDECSIFIDSNNMTVSIFINENTFVEDLPITDTYFNHASSLDTSRNIAFLFPCSDGPGLQYKCCDLNYFRITMEDWE